MARLSKRLILPALALLFTLLNCAKPLHIDDAAYYCYAAHIAEHPLSPYDFEILWYDQPRPANQVLAPPLLLYWWAAGLHLFGDQPFLWKLWLLPFNLLLVWSLYHLCRRFARGLELPLVLLTVFSPALLPSLNLMLDVPALSLSLTALAIFLRACDRDDIRLSLLAGLVTGLAMQTKYTAFVTPVVLLVYACGASRVRHALWSVAVALALFAGWELFVALRHGEAHFLANLGQQNGRPGQKMLHLLQPLLTLVGGLAPAVTLLGLLALRWSGRAVLLVGIAMAAGYAVLAWVPLSHSVLLRSPKSQTRLLSLNHALHAALGLAFALVLFVVIRRLLRPKPVVGSDITGAPSGTLMSARRLDWFLVGWLALEVAGYLTLTPFPAARRVLGIVVVSAMLIGRLASRALQEPSQRLVVHRVVAAGIALGLGFHVVDWTEARAIEKVVARAVDRLPLHDEKERVWYSGVWSFKFYAERAGMRTVVPERSQLRAGDWLVVADDPIPHLRLCPRQAPLRIIESIDSPSWLPFRTLTVFYGGRQPVDHHEGPRCSLTIYRVMHDFVPVVP
jgi:hypothetical protein